MSSSLSKSSNGWIKPIPCWKHKLKKKELKFIGVMRQVSVPWSTTPVVMRRGGKTPVLTLSQSQRERVNMISSITNQGKVRFMLYDDKFTAQVFIKFLKQLVKGSSNKVFLILDNLRVHHAKVVKKWLIGKEDEIELFFLPSYSPDLNPDEYLNGDLKAKISTDRPTKKKGEMKKKMRSIQSQPERVKSYFKHSKISYAA